MPLRHQIAWVLVGTMVAIVSTGQVTRAQSDDETDEAAGVVPLQPIREQFERARRLRVLQVNEKEINRWIAAAFGTVTGLRDHLVTCLTNRLDKLEITCHLTEGQRKKLQLAGRGDIKRFMDRLDFTLKNRTATDIDDVPELMLVLRDVQTAPKWIFEAGSLFSKTVGNTLSHEQFALNDTPLRQKNSAQYLRAVTETVRRLAKLVDMSEKQCRELSNLIATETRAPRRFGPSEYAFVMFQTSRLPEAKLKTILTASQWKVLERQLASWADSQPILNKEGFDFDDGPLVETVGPLR